MVCTGISCLRDREQPGFHAHQYSRSITCAFQYGGIVTVNITRILILRHCEFWVHGYQKKFGSIRIDISASALHARAVKREQILLVAILSLFGKAWHSMMSDICVWVLQRNGLLLETFLGCMDTDTIYMKWKDKGSHAWGNEIMKIETDIMSMIIRMESV